MRLLSTLSALLLALGSTQAASPYPQPTPDTEGNRLLQRYWESQTREIERNGGLKQVRDAKQWQSLVPLYRRQLGEMLGIEPLPQRTDLKAVKTGELKGEGWKMEKMHFQAMPGLYVSANFYLPENIEKPVPAILYVCGHAVVVKDGVSCGNKAGYHHHGIWFARHGYACLIIDTVELGEIRGEHHGTYNKGRWWWFSRGYTPAGLECWSGMRGLDYLQSRPEVDGSRLGVTGRSGGGAYSWFIAAMDERIKAAAPTAGVTSMRTQVPQGCVEGHCDCMFFVNTYRWDFDRMVALVAPRPLLIVNTDKDPIFPIAGVFALHQEVSRIYEMLGASGKLGLQVAEGPHQDLQPLNIGAFHWFERHLKGADPMAVIDEGARKQLDPLALRAFSELPKDEINTRADEFFVPKAKPALPASQGDWGPQREALLKHLRGQVLAGWPKKAVGGKPKLQAQQELEGQGIWQSLEFSAQQGLPLKLWLRRTAGEIKGVRLLVLDEKTWPGFALALQAQAPNLCAKLQMPAKEAGSLPMDFGSPKPGEVLAFVAPRGIGPTQWTGSEKAQIQRLRRFYLLGQTVDSMRAWDIGRAVASLRQLSGLENLGVEVQADGEMAVNALYASFAQEGLTRLSLQDMPASHDSGPAYLTVLKAMDLPQVAALAAEGRELALYRAKPGDWQWAQSLAGLLGWRPAQLRISAGDRP